jgi:CheY-like chemotaxis protein/two-component sensor histidine kinase
MQERAELANKTKTVFLANISHELRTPLTAILGFAELLQMEIESVGAREKLDVLRRNSLHLLDLLNDLLDLSKIESGFLQIALEECDLLNLLQDVQAGASNRAREKNLQLTFEVVNEIPLIVVTDPIRYRQIVTNLLSNAIKYTDQGRISVTVRRIGSPGQEQIELAVTDTGRGISSSERENLFKPFVRGTDVLIRKTQGSGLGLSISRQLARQMGGDITFDSTPGLGSQFRFILPLRQPPGSVLLEPGIIAKHEKALAVDPVPRLHCRVMIADDHEDIRQYLSDALKPTQATIITATNGREAVDYILAHRNDDELPDLILMDFHMPVMNGQEAVAAMRSQGIHIPVIAITAGAMKGERERCLLAGFNDYLSKPFDTKLLLDKIAKFLHQNGSASMLDGAVRDGSCQPLKKLLVVDDNVDVTLAVKELLQARGGFEVETVFDGQSAIERMNHFSPDAVLLDIQLPDIDGFEVVQRVGNRESNVRPVFIAMTGYADAGEKQRALRNGFNRYLVKPFTLTEMINALDAALCSETDDA